MANDHEPSVNLAKIAEGHKVLSEVLEEVMRLGFSGTALLEVPVQDGIIQCLRSVVEDAACCESMADRESVFDPARSREAHMALNMLLSDVLQPGFYGWARLKLRVRDGIILKIGGKRKQITRV